ncbi:MAG TPA: hypothetical protein VEC16_06005 [Alphaproteobacteria bacterium]|nr:hypothetical protein [Alphaproteobacteria bacterium]
MNKTESGQTEKEKIRQYHKSRRMFCIYKKKLIIAERNVDYSHKEWFEKNNWKYQDKNLIDEIARGIVDETGDVYFYIGEDHKLTEKAEKSFFANLKELSEKLKLNPKSHIFGGVTMGKPGDKWPGIKDYGTIKENLKRIETSG